ncbi:hypothetical protein [Bacillus sp. REN16]|uniref:hypothetical protein n=1 Tax=Bacillus sp. REN16 TaxID=2887296 RepID=UPI001E4F4518|nr:hypothetical protein [Bacillus sp. REN16]MCC3356800.1 hypothetical protein [Bacillus sp. REN16]
MRKQVQMHASFGQLELENAKTSLNPDVIRTAKISGTTELPHVLGMKKIGELQHCRHV